MFTLSGVFLEDGENLFQDFWSPFSISFLRFSARNYLKKSQPTYRAVSDLDTWPGRLYKPGGQPRRAPALTLSRAAAH